MSHAVAPRHPWSRRLLPALLLAALLVTGCSAPPPAVLSEALRIPGLGGLVVQVVVGVIIVALHLRPAPPPTVPLADRVAVLERSVHGMGADLHKVRTDTEEILALLARTGEVRRG